MTGAARGALSLDDVRAHREQILELAARHGLTGVRIFGSVARVARGRSALDEGEDLQLAVVRLIEIIGEACATVSKQVRDAHPDVRGGSRRACATAVR